MALRRLKADDIEQGAFAARHLAVGQSAVGAFEILETRNTLHHFFARNIKSRKLFHGVSSLAFSLIAQHSAADDEPHDFVGAFQYLMNAHIAQDAFDGMIA